MSAKKIFHVEHFVCILSGDHLMQNSY